jgi:hypothetical protein
MSQAYSKPKIRQAGSHHPETDPQVSDINFCLVNCV